MVTPAPNRLWPLLLVLIDIASTTADRQLHFHVLADMGHSCTNACATRHSKCDLTLLFTSHESEIMQIFRELEVFCDWDTHEWSKPYQPAVVVDPFDRRFGKCVGWRRLPKGHDDCSARWPTVRRLCRCVSLNIFCPEPPLTGDI